MLAGGCWGRFLTGAVRTGFVRMFAASRAGVAAGADEVGYLIEALGFAGHNRQGDGNAGFLEQLVGVQEDGFFAGAGAAAYPQRHVRSDADSGCQGVGAFDGVGQGGGVPLD